MQWLHFEIAVYCYQVFSGSFLRSYGKDIINIHHGLLPSFKGGNPSKQVQFLDFSSRMSIYKFDIYGLHVA